jgi:hypothetical protein
LSQGTLWFQPIQHILSTSVTNVSGAKAYFYLAGTTTAVAVYTDVGLTIPQTQPVVADANGIFSEIFLTPGTAYKVDLQSSSGVSLPGYPADNQLAIPAAAATVDTTETAGEALSSVQAVYVSAGDAGKTAGQLYKADSSNAYSSTLYTVGMMPSALAQGAQGVFRTAGQIGGLIGLTVGAKYYVGVAGAITSTAPATNARFVGQADSTTSLIIAANPWLANIPVAQGGTGQATLTAHGVVIGEGTSGVAVTAPGTTGQVLLGATGADPAFGSLGATFGASLVLLKSNSGTDSSVGATTVDTIAMASGLTAKDVLQVVLTVKSVTQATASITLLNTTDGITVSQVVQGGTTVSANETFLGSVFVQDSQTSTTSVIGLSNSRGSIAGATGTLTVAAFTTAYTGNWTLGLQHGGVTAGGTLQWRWSVYKLAGQ